MRSGALVVPLFLLVTACEKHAALSPPNVPASLAVTDAESQPVLRARARGVQVYKCEATEDDGGASYAWKLTGPKAKLYDDGGKEIGTHTAGPTWALAADGSSAVGKVLAKASKDKDAVPWLLLKVEKTTGDGLLARARFIQRVDTRGGVAPAGGCSEATAGANAEQDYTATYVFWGTR